MTDAPKRCDPLALIVDDDREILALGAEIFAALGYRPLTASNGVEALDILRKNNGVAVLFSDIRMPGMSGEELARAAVAVRPGLRIVLTSGARRPAIAAAFVQKPYRAADVVAALGCDAPAAARAKPGAPPKRR